MIPAHVKQYVHYIESAAKAHSNGYLIRPIVMTAILDQESQGGRRLIPPGPNGTGDFELRNSQRYADGKYFRALKREDGSSGFMPYDLKGWGRGLFQIDFGYHTEWCLLQLSGGAFLWELPESNAAKACSIYADNLKHLDGNEDAAIAAYNCGWQRVLQELENLTPPDDPVLRRKSRLVAMDRHTTHGNYLASVLAKIERFTEPQDIPPPPKPGAFS